MACTHPADRVISETGFCFACHQEQRAIARAARVLELTEALESGRIVRQLQTFWSTAGIICTTHGSARADACFIERCQSDPAYLADHLENRENGFGFDTAIVSVRARCTQCAEPVEFDSDGGSNICQSCVDAYVNREEMAREGS